MADACVKIIDVCSTSKLKRKKMHKVVQKTTYCITSITVLLCSLYAPPEYDPLPSHSISLSLFFLLHSLPLSLSLFLSYIISLPLSLSLFLSLSVSFSLSLSLHILEVQWVKMGRLLYKVKGEGSYLLL